MFGSIWQIIRGVYTRRRSGIDKGNIEHVRADLRFRLAMVEYAYFGRSGKRVTRCLAELKSVLGEKAVHRYLRTLDPDLRTQFVERFQGAARRHAHEDREPAREHRARSRRHDAARPATAAAASAEDVLAASNVVPFEAASRRSGAPDMVAGTDHEAGARRDPRSVDSGD